MLNWLFGRRRLTAEQIDEAMEQAIALLQRGDTLRAEESIHKVVEDAAARCGSDSPLYAKALFNEATVLCGIGDLSRAAAKCRAAADVPAADEHAQKDRLTYLMNLGEILTRAGSHGEAEVALRQGLAERETFYGTQHPGYAFGLAPLAENLLAQDRADEALPLIDQAVEINWNAGHEQVASDLAVRAFIVKAAEGPDAESLDAWNNVPASIQTQIVSHCLTRAEHAARHVSQAVFAELRRRLQRTPDVEATDLLNATIALANAARETGDHDARIEASQVVVKLCGGLDEPHHAIEAWQALAFAFSDAGRQEEAEQAYQEAVARAEQHVDAKHLANVLRNFAIWADDVGRQDRAAALHDRAVEAAAGCSDAVMQGRCLAARGIFHQHSGQQQTAQSDLKQSLRWLPATHPDAFCAQSHLQALQRGEDCTCGQEDSQAAISSLVEQQLRREIGGDLLKSVRIEAGDEGPDIKVELNREPSPAELEHLDRVVNQTLAQMRRQHGQAGYSD